EFSAQQAALPFPAKLCERKSPPHEPAPPVLNLPPQAARRHVPVRRDLSTKVVPDSARRAIPFPNQRLTESFLCLHSLFGRNKFSQLGEFHARRARVHSRNQQAAIPIQKSQSEHKTLQKIPRRREPHSSSPLPLSFIKHLL